MNVFQELFGKFWHRGSAVPEDNRGLERYPSDEYLETDLPAFKHPRIKKIVVPDQYSKDQLLLAIKHLHYARDIDTGYMAVNELVHLYQNPDLIVIEPTL